MTDLTISTVQGEPRIRDLDLAERLGFTDPHKIRPLIERHKGALAALGVSATVAETSGKKGGRPGKAYYLNRKQAVFITAKSDTPTATDITIEVIEKFDAYERGLIAPPVAADIDALEVAARAAKATAAIIDISGLPVDRSQRLFMMRSTAKRIAGVDIAEVIGLPLSLPAPDEHQSYYAARWIDAIGSGTGLGRKSRNSRQSRLGLAGEVHQTSSRGRKNKLIWQPTSKAQGLFRLMDSGKTETAPDGSGRAPVMQLKWSPDIVDVRRPAKAAA